MATAGETDLMARHKRDYEGERFTEKVTLQFTRAQRETLQRAADAAGATFSEHARDVLVRRTTAAQIVAGTRRAPDSRDLVNAIAAVGNNVNQLARLCNTEKTAPQLEELRSVTADIKAALARVLAL